MVKRLAVAWTDHISMLRARAGQFLFPERALANSNCRSRAGQCRSLGASWLGLFPGRALANALPQARALPNSNPWSRARQSWSCSPSASWPIPFSGRALAGSRSLINAVPRSYAGWSLFPCRKLPRWSVASWLLSTKVAPVDVKTF